MSTPSPCKHRLQFRHDRASCLDIGRGQRFGQLGVEVGVGIGAFVPRLARAVGQSQYLHPQRAHVPVGHREGILRPVVPETRSRNDGALYVQPASRICAAIASQLT